jgi:hypothetical protein
MTKTLTSLTFSQFKHPLSIWCLPTSRKAGNAFLGAFLGIFLLISCNKKMAIDKMPTTRIEFGHGGGFTGAVTTFILLDNGHIYADTLNNKAYTRLRKVGKEEATTLYSDCEKLKTLKTDAPGNMYYFVTMKKGDEIPRRWIFGDPSVSTPSELESLYKRLVGLVPVK